MEMTDVLKCDVLVIGGGFAAMYTAAEASRLSLDVVLLSNLRVGKSGCSIFATGYAAALGHEDSADTPGCHRSDTLASGRGLCDPRVVDAVCEEAVPRLLELEELGVRFEKQNGRFRQYRGGGHSFPRTCMTEQHLPSGLVQPIIDHLQSTSVRVLERHDVVELLVADDVVVGALSVDAARDAFVQIEAAATVIASGGFGRLYLETSNPSGVYGDGHALGLLAGARLRDMEFVQFRPYQIIRPEALRGQTLASATFEYGATLRNRAGEDLLEQLAATGHPRTRDVVSRLVTREVAAGRGIFGGVAVDLSGISASAFAALNPLTDRLLKASGVDLDAEPLLVTPQAHFSIGGIGIDALGRTSRPGLFAVGEVAAGMHGANRLQDNALSEIFVIGKRIAAEVIRMSPRCAVSGFSQAARAALSDAVARSGQTRLDRDQLHELLPRLRSLVTSCLGPVRSEAGLLRMLAELDGLTAEAVKLPISSPSELADLSRLRFRLLMAEAVATSALHRRESRGAHARSDYEHEDPLWARSQTITVGNEFEPAMLWSGERFIKGTGQDGAPDCGVNVIGG